MILSVIRFEIDDPETTSAIEKAWKAYQKANQLDVYGKPAGAKAEAGGLPDLHSH